MDIAKGIRPILFAVLVGTAVGSLESYVDALEGSLDAAGTGIGVPAAIPILFGLLAPPFLLLIQKPIFQSGRPRWFFWFHRRINLLFLFAFYSLSYGALQIILLGSIDPRLWNPQAQFFSGGGVGFFIAGLIEHRWAQASKPETPSRKET